MKVLLTAFAGKLVGEPMDYPENTPPEIKMVMDFDMKPSFTEKEYEPSSTPLHKVATFVRARRAVFVGGIECVEYKLVDVS